MTLLGLLVKELPGRGGWPDGVEKIGQDYDCELKFLGAKRSIYRSDIYTEQLCAGHRAKGSAGYGETVTREQYEAAIAAHQTIWNGEGLPPIGCECELVNFYGNDFPEFVGEHGEEVKIIGSGFTNGCPVAFYEADGGRGGMLAYAVEQCFRPIRTEADRNREEIVKQIIKGSRLAQDSVAEAIYDAIAAGKIPGVKLV